MKRIISILILFIILLIVGFAFQALTVNQQVNLWTFEIYIGEYYFQLIAFLIVSIILSIGLMLILSIFIFGNRKKLERRDKIKEKFLPTIQDTLMNYLTDMTKPDNEFRYPEKEYFEYLKRISKGKFRKQLLINQICDLNLNLSGLNSENLKKLYYNLNLHKRTFKKIYSLKWHKKIKGFKELYAMNITEKNNVLYKYINSRNDLVRIEAQIALVDLSKEESDVDAFDFLHKLTTPFSLWEQITLHNILVQRNIEIPDFGEWISSKNDTVVMFCLRMIREFKQIDNVENVILLLSHKNENIRKLAIQILGDFKEGGNFLKLSYKNEIFDNKLEILKSLRKIKNYRYINFLQMVIDSEDSADLQIEAAKAIREVGRKGNAALKKMLTSDYKDYNIIIKHVKDRRIP